MPGWMTASQRPQQPQQPQQLAMPMMSPMSPIPSLSNSGGGGMPGGRADFSLGAVIKPLVALSRGTLGAYQSPLDTAASKVLGGLTRGRTSTILNSGGGEGFEEDFRNTSRILLGR